MNVGFIGLGRVGLTIALAMERMGRHTVYGYDISPLPAAILAGTATPPPEQDIPELLDGNMIRMVASVGEIVACSDLVMVCVQTPHPDGWTGSEPMRAPSDFDYSYLTAAVTETSNAAREQDKQITLVVVSTVLPGTCERLLLPDLAPQVTLVYGPSLISLGTVARDFLAPEVVIAGSVRPKDAIPYVGSLPIPGDVPVVYMSLPSAELAKMSYNLMTVAKLAVSGTVARLAEQCGADADDVTRVLSAGTKRLLSPMYLKAGMPSGGPCHPRDVNALAWLAGGGGPALPLALARDREHHAGWLARFARREHERTGLPVVILGREYKAGTGVTAGSTALLVTRCLRDLDPYVDDSMTVDVGEWVRNPAVFFIGCAYSRYKDWEFPPGSVVIDPHGYIPARPGVTLITPGRRSGV